MENCFWLCRCQVPVCYKIFVWPHSYIRLAAVISYYFTQIVNVKGIETEDLLSYDLSWIWLHVNLCLPRTVVYMSFLLALIFYNASLQINIVPQCKDWSIFCFDLADDLVPCKTKSAKIRLENDRNDMDCWSSLIIVVHQIDPDQSSIVFKRARCKKMVSSDVRITGAVARQTDQTGLSTGRFNWNNGFLLGKC